MKKFLCITNVEQKFLPHRAGLRGPEKIFSARWSMADTSNVICYRLLKSFLNIEVSVYLTDFTKTYLYKIQDSFQLCSSKASANQ